MDELGDAEAAITRLEHDHRRLTDAQRAEALRLARRIDAYAKM